VFLDFEDMYNKNITDYAQMNENEGILSFIIDSGANLGKGLRRGIELLFVSI